MTAWRALLAELGDWVGDAACRDSLEKDGTDLFFSEKQRDRVKAKREYCSVCPVAWECLLWAWKTHADFGVYGGMDPDERDNFRTVYQRQLTSPDRRLTRPEAQHAALMKKLRTQPTVRVRRR